MSTRKNPQGGHDGRDEGGRYRKGAPSPNPRGRPKAGPIDLAAFLDEPILVALGKRMCSFEVSLTNLANRAIGGDMRAAKRFLEICNEVGLLGISGGGSDCGIVLRMSPAWRHNKWMETYESLGIPPWPGMKNALDNDNWREEALLDD